MSFCDSFLIWMNLAVGVNRQAEYEVERQRIALIYGNEHKRHSVVVLPNIESGNVVLRGLFGDRYLSIQEQEQYFFKAHQKAAQKQYCHCYGGKKYCFHTGKILITDRRGGI